MVSIEKNVIQNNDELYFKLYSNQEENLNSENLILADSKKETEEEWYLEIPKINLKANIKEGTNQEVLNEYIGHFENTGIISGNICLAAHNRGYSKNYFSKIHLLENGDEIQYYYKNQKIIFKVTEQYIIEDTNIQILKDYNKDELTLITCVENKPSLRRCIKAIKE